MRTDNLGRRQRVDDGASGVENPPEDDEQDRDRAREMPQLREPEDRRPAKTDVHRRVEPPWSRKPSDTEQNYRQRGDPDDAQHDDGLRGRQHGDPEGRVRARSDQRDVRVVETPQQVRRAWTPLAPVVDSGRDKEHARREREHRARDAVCMRRPIGSEPEARHERERECADVEPPAKTRLRRCNRDGHLLNLEPLEIQRARARRSFTSRPSQAPWSARSFVSESRSAMRVSVLVSFSMRETGPNVVGRERQAREVSRQALRGRTRHRTAMR